MKVRTVRMLIAGLTIAGSTVAATPAWASSPSASCVGQALSTFGPAFGAQLGQQIAFEAHNPETVGGSNLGEVVASFAQADRQACPEE